MSIFYDKKKKAAYDKAYGIAHREKRNARNKSYRAAHKGIMPIKTEAEREKKIAYDKTYRIAHKQKHDAYNKAHRAANKEKYKAYDKAYHATHRERGIALAKAYRAAHLEEIKDWGRRYRHGVSQAEFDALLNSQGGACAICRKTNWNGRGPNIDHDHVTGNIRGILCHNCNVALGHIGDDPKIARAMGDYLEQ
jgi:hypothetical protein